MKTIICGPPHSGKSVFISNLVKLLPSGHYIRINANGDGEGTWSNNPDQDDVQKTRVKCSNSERDFLRWRSQIVNAKQDIVIVDIGGRLQEDKIPLFEACDSFVVVSNDAQMIDRWKAFGSNHSCKCVGAILSELGDLHEKVCKNQSCVCGVMSGLERGHDLSGSELINAIADMIVSSSDFKGYQKLSGDNIIDMYDLGIKLGMSRHWRTTTGIDVHNVWYKPERAQVLHDYLSSYYTNDGRYQIYGARSIWASCLVATTISNTNASNIEVCGFSSGTNIPIMKIPIENKNAGKLKCVVRENEEFVRLAVEIPNQLAPRDRKNMVLPRFDVKKKLLLSGKIPSWLAISIILSYKNGQKYVHCPGIGYIKVADKENKGYGEIISLPDKLE